MKLDVSPGKYVVAVSGGVDSVVLLDMLVRTVAEPAEAGHGRSFTLTVAHFDHGIRTDSRADRLFVQDLARRYGLPFVYDEGKLGPGASEATARRARYDFLRTVRQASGSGAILTAHHQDDLLETAILNVLRGTGRKGLASLGNRSDLVRPFLAISKQELIAYANAHHLAWREDSTNADPSYRRNYVRSHVLTRFDADARKRLEALVIRQRQLNDELDTLLISLLHVQPGRDKLSRPWFISLPHDIAKETLAMWLRLHGLRSFDRRTLERLAVALKVARPGRHIDVFAGWSIVVQKSYLALQGPER